MKCEVFAFVLTTTCNLEMNSNMFQRFEVFSSRKDFFGKLVRCRHSDNRKAVFGFSVRLVTVEDLDIFNAALTVKTLSTEKCNFHSRTCHFFCSICLRLVARFCLFRAEFSFQGLSLFLMAFLQLEGLFSFNYLGDPFGPGSICFANQANKLSWPFG